MTTAASTPAGVGAGAGAGVADIEARPRQAWVDQARWVAVALVVVGHLVGLLRGRSDVARTVSDFVYMFHIPTLVLLSGWASRRATASARGLSRIVWQLLVPFVLFQLLAFALGYVLNEKDPSWSFTQQTFGLWFLVALAGWRLLGPWFHGFRWPVLVGLALALLAGLSPAVGETFSLSRVLVFLPLFLAGPWVVDHVGVWRTRRALRAAAAAVLLLALAFVAYRGADFDRTIFFGRDDYASLDDGWLGGPVHRLGMLAVSTLLSVALLLVVPGSAGQPGRLGTLVAGWGRRTLYVYLLHLPLLLVAGWTGWPRRGPDEVAAVVAVLLGVVLAAVLASRPVAWVTEVLVEPRGILDRAVARVRPARETRGARPER